MAVTTQQNTIKPGYKKTEVGVIPENWVLLKLGDVVEFLDGKRRPVKDGDRAKMRGDFPYYGASGIVDYVNDYLFDEELILLGEDGENILSRNCPLAFRVSGKIWVNNHAHVLRPKSGVDIGFLTEYLESVDYAQYNTGTAQPKLNKLVCSIIPVLSPPLEEQRAIAGALSEMDALIASLGELIAKKRGLKQATMQQLLTGKRRLTGYSGEWETRGLGKLCRSIVDGTHFTPEYVDDGVPFYSVENVTSDDFTNTKFISISEHEQLIRRCKPEKGDILLTRIGSIGDTKFIDWDVNASIYVSLALLKVSEYVDAQYLYCYTKSHQFIKNIEDRSLLNAAPRKINMGEIASVPISLPPTRDEQAAIAAVLSDMDAEIAALELRREKTQVIKQGMMQELLTGETRLI
jgi:type I restriction enzyme, S subunit